MKPQMNRSQGQRNPKSAPARPLSHKAERFVAEYLKDFNGTRAAIRAGYSPHTARIQASQMLSNVKVARAVREAGQRAFRSAQIASQRAVGELSKHAFFDPASLFRDDGTMRAPAELSPEARQVASAIEVAVKRDGTVVRRYRCNTKLRALIALMNHYSSVARHIGIDLAMLIPDLSAPCPERSDERSESLASRKRRPSGSRRRGDATLKS